MKFEDKFTIMKNEKNLLEQVNLDLKADLERSIGIKTENKKLKLQLSDVDSRHKLEMDLEVAKVRARENTELRVKTAQVDAIKKVMHERFTEIEYLKYIVDQNQHTKECKVIKKAFDKTMESLSKNNWAAQQAYQDEQLRKAQMDGENIESKVIDLENRYEGLVQSMKFKENEILTQESYKSKSRKNSKSRVHRHQMDIMKV